MIYRNKYICIYHNIYHQLYGKKKKKNCTDIYTWRNEQGSDLETKSSLTVKEYCLKQTLEILLTEISLWQLYL